MHLAIFLTLVWMQQEDEHGKMDYQHWPADLIFLLFDNNRPYFLII